MSEDRREQHELEEQQVKQYPPPPPQEHLQPHPQQHLQPDEASPQQIVGKRRHRRSEINLALFLFQRSYNGQYEDLREVIESTKIKQDKKCLGLNARDAQGLPILIYCLKGSINREDEDHHLECIKILVSTGVVNVNAKDNQGRTPLHWSITLNKINICTFLLQRSDIELMNTDGDEVEEEDNDVIRVQSPLHLAISTEEHGERFVELLCRMVPSQVLEVLDSEGRTPLFHAMYVGSVRMFGNLLAAGANPNTRTPDRRYLVDHAVDNNLHAFLQLLLQYGVDVYPNGLGQFNAIHLAATKKNSKSLELMIGYRSEWDLNSSDSNGWTPLMLAAYNDLENNVELLLEAKVSPIAIDADGKSALHHTCSNATAACTRALLDGSSALLNLHDNSYHVALHDAIMFDNSEVVRLLLDRGADYEVVDGEGHDLIHYTTEFSAVECLEVLVSFGVSVNTANEDGVFPIHYAVRLPFNNRDEEKTRKRLHYLDTFLQLPDVDLCVCDREGLQPIHWAASVGCSAAVEKLVQNGVPPNAETRDEKYSPLHLACRSQSYESVHHHLQLPGVEVNARDSNGCTPLMTSCVLDEYHVCELLLNNGADVECKDAHGKTAAHYAADNESSMDCLSLLAMGNVNLDVKDYSGQTPLQVACLNKNKACLTFLLSQDCDVDAALENGLTALHLAVEMKDPERTQLLLQHHANCNAILFTEEDTYTALDIALENNDYKCIKLLQKFEARTSHSVRNNAASTIQHYWRNCVLHQQSRWNAQHQERDDQHIQREGEGDQEDEQQELEQDEHHQKPELQQEQLGVKQQQLHLQEQEQQQAHQRRSKLEYNGFSDSVRPVVERDYHGESLRASNIDGGTTDSGHDDQYLGGQLNGVVSRGSNAISEVRELMKEAEAMLTRARTMNRVCDSMMGTETFHAMRKANHIFMHEKYRRQMKDNAKSK